MLDLDPRFLGAVPTPGVLNLARPFSSVCWSRDNQVALITDGGGVFVVDFIHTHDELESEASRLIGNESRIQCVKPKNEKELENYTGISLSRLLRSTNKNEVFDIVRDPIICPKELVNAEVNLCFRKVSWSERPMKLRPRNDGKFEYILGTLDSHYCLRLYIKASSLNQDEEDQVLDEEREEWEICVDFTESYRQMLMAQFWSINVENEDNFSAGLFNEHKRRMYELSTVDFLWLPSWDDERERKYKQAYEGDSYTILVTAHASGDICIWHVCINYTIAENPETDHVGNKYQPNFYLTLEFRRNLVPGEIVSSLTFHKISSCMCLLIIGTTQGTVKVFRISYNRTAEQALKPLPVDESPQQLQKYVLDNGTLLCDKDGIEVLTTCGVELPKDESGVDRLLLYVFRHPNFMMPFELAVPTEPINGVDIVQVHPAVRIVQGILTGVLLSTQNKSAQGNLLITLTQRGVLSWMYIQDGHVSPVSSSDLGYLENADTQEAGNGGDSDSRDITLVKKRLQFGGLAISPNEAMICVSKTLTEYYNHLALRTPSVLQFHSMIPNGGVWPFLYEKCVLNDFFFHRMADVLTAFRIIMPSTENLLSEVLDWAVPLNSKSLQDLQILFWILRIQPKVDRNQLAFAYNLRNEQAQPYHELKSKEVLAARREIVVSERIMQLRCWELINRIVETPERYNLEGNVANLQSLMLMYEYLETKTKFLETREPLPLRPRVLVEPPPRKPACPLCGKSTILLSEPPEDRWKVGVDFIVEHPIDEEVLEGVLWHEQTHSQKSRNHPISNCALSLIPTPFPYRSCQFCGTICMLYPTFEQEPLCPFCNGVMYPPVGFYEDEEDSLVDESTTNNEELLGLVQEIKEQQEEELRQKARAAPMSRRARIENMYIDS